MHYLAVILAATVLAGCTWETYQDADGHTSSRQKYEKDTRVYYRDDTYSRNVRYNQFRSEQHAIRPTMNVERDVRGTNWQKPRK